MKFLNFLIIVNLLVAFYFNVSSSLLPNENDSKENTEKQLMTQQMSNDKEAMKNVFINQF